MRKVTHKQRQNDVRRHILNRKRRSLLSKTSSRRLRTERLALRQKAENWLESRIHEGLSVAVTRHRRVTIYLPPTMNYSTHYDVTCLHLDAIRKLCSRRSIYSKVYKLASVCFRDLIEISAPAALVLTAEISKWDDAIRKGVIPDINNWHPEIFKQFLELGYFDLFKRVPGIERHNSGTEKSLVSFVRYIKGRCGDKGKTKELKQRIREVVGDKVDKWTFLHSGLSEAITNVTHHAYPDECGFRSEEKYWYLTGSFNRSTKVLKIVFYDQGIGIPASLPASDVWEKVLDYLSGLELVERKRDATLLKAAVEIDRTRTGDSDRGKGLQDLLEFIKQKNDGNLSILSKRGLYRYTLENGQKRLKTESFNRSVDGTLIIWSAKLAA